MLRLIAFAGAFFATSVCAQTTYGFATIAPGTMLHTLGSVIAKVAQDNSKLQLRVQGFGGDAGAVDSVNNKASDFLGLEIGETADAYHGRGNWEGKQRANLRMAMTMFPIMVAPYVRKDSPVQSIAELKGRRMPSGWAQQTGVIQHASAMLANGGLTYKDVVSVPAVNVVRAADDFKAGKLDVLYFAVGAPKVQEVASSVGGLRQLAFSNSADALARMHAVRPEYYVVELKPAPHIVGIDKPTLVQAFDFIIGVGAHVSDDAVYDFVKAVHGNRKALAEGHPSLNLFNPDNAGKLQPTLPHHPGAIRFFKEAGIWKGA